MKTARLLSCLLLPLASVGMACASQARQGNPIDRHVRTADEFRRAVLEAKPNTRILLGPGDYQGPFFFSNVRGEQGRPIIIAGEDPQHPPRIRGGGECLHFSSVAWLELKSLLLTDAGDNGLNMDDGGKVEMPSHDLLLSRIQVKNIGPEGNRDGIKLSGLDRFSLVNCSVERWGSDGSAIDMVGCHHGTVKDCVFRQGGASAVQMKGGCADMRVTHCLFENYGERGVNIGGSTGMPFFRPPVTSMPKNGRYEARAITVEHCTFTGGSTPVAFVGVDGARVESNTIYLPQRWALRILQETRGQGFVPSRNGVFEKNLIVFHSDQWSEGGVNIGSGTAPDTFLFARNFWFCVDRPDRSSPKLPTPESQGVYGRDPLFRDAAKGDFRLNPESPAKGFGAEIPPTFLIRPLLTLLIGARLRPQTVPPH
ncbi:MAG: hypothetical protein JWN14_2398 [Chthonomonadales bacterium]|nr:hypothetical protein [Chthonomonadales bacterium]